MLNVLKRKLLKLFVLTLGGIAVTVPAIPMLVDRSTSGPHIGKLGGCAAAASIAGGNSHSARNATCMACTPDGCANEVGEGQTLVLVNTSIVGSCIDFDHDGIPHCVMTTRKTYNIVDLSTEVTGTCYKQLCSAASGVIGSCGDYWSP